MSGILEGKSDFFLLARSELSFGSPPNIEDIAIRFSSFSGTLDDRAVISGDKEDAFEKGLAGISLATT